MITLTELHADIDARISVICAEHRDWPCHRGCAVCCHRLVDIPRLSAAELGLADAQ